jgi:valyl-tRNA synthetase
MRQIGDSCDWSREKFTLSPELSPVVREAFVRLYEEGLIYRENRLLNWCPVCLTVLSDLEVVHEERQGHLWHIKYAVAGTNEFLVVATTRPETMLGDTAVAVNPEDERYAHLVGKKALLPLMNREIPIIADAMVDRDFGTGAVKITPAHDPNDFEVGRRHKLAEIDVMTDDGKMNVAAGAYAGMDRFEARKKIVEDLKVLGLLEKVTIRMVPHNRREEYLNWLRNIRDWTLSRQLWWGHRIPAWYCKENRHVTVAREAPAKCATCGSTNLEQDHDVLDTWFSSGLWPFSTLGWPENTADFKTYYPTSLLITGYDILFFWVARMIMMGIHFTGKVPFRAVYLHSLVRTGSGEKMSKSKGTGLDPVALNQQYGTDAMRFCLASMAAPGTDIVLSEDKLTSARNFANKIWNAARFLFVNLDKFEESGTKLEELAAPEVRAKAPYSYRGSIPLVDAWMFARLGATVELVDEALANYRFHEAAQGVYQFFWGDFCDWYIEWAKPELMNADRERATVAWKNLFAAFDAALRLLHPFMPFLTEELWHQLPQPAGAKSIALDQFPEAHAHWKNAKAIGEVDAIQEVVTALRNIRAELKLDPKKRVAADFTTSDARTGALIEANRGAIGRFAFLSELRIVPRQQFEAKSGAVRSTATFDIRIAYSDTVDVSAEKARLKKEIEGLLKAIASKERQLGDETFRSRAPEKIIAGLEATLAEQRIELRKLQDRLSQIEGDS